MASLSRAIGFAALSAFLSQVDGFRKTKASKSMMSSSCGAKGLSAMGNGTHGQIVNGEQAAACEWKWQAGLKEGTMPFCGGMLISPQWVLTAAHCAETSSNPGFDVVLGDWKPRKTSGKEQERRAVEVIRHPGYNDNTMEWDLAMVKLSSPVDMTDCVGAVCLPTGADVKPGAKCWITGWGTLSSGGRQPDVLQQAEVSIISNSDCTKVYDYASNEITKTMICAQGRTPDGQISDACQGDSGGPLVCESGGAWTLYGATSWGYGCAGKKYPGIWARVHEGMPWIESILEGNPAPSPGPAPGPAPAASCAAIGCWEKYDRDRPCQCNSKCPRYGNCCSDFNSLCKGR